MSKKVNLVSSLGGPKARMDSYHKEEPMLEVDLEKIKPRLHGDIRILKPFHVVELAEAIAMVGLLHPVVVDSRYRVLAGMHRLSAWRLLLTLLSGANESARRDAIAPLLQQFVGETSRVPELLFEKALSIDTDSFQKRYPSGRIPINVMPFDSENAENSALDVELVENDKRLDFSKAEIERIVVTLKDKGYTESRGRPKSGAKPIVPKLALILGKSRRQAQRLLDTRKEASEPASSLPALARQIVRSLPELEESGAAQARNVTNHLKEALKGLEILIK